MSAAEEGPEEVERALSLLVQASRVSPPLRDAIRVVEDELRRLQVVPRLRPLSDDPPEGGECDWGFCSEPAVMMRWHQRVNDFLPVCAVHACEADA